MAEDKTSKERKKKYFEEVEKNIEKDGCHVTVVLEEENFTPFGYSVL